MFKKEKNIVVAKFLEGEIMENLQNLMKELDAEAAIIMNGVGMLEDATIGYFNGSEYITEKLEEAAELVSLQGNIGKSDEGYVIHAHVALACSDHMLRGGHLIGGRVKVVNEISLYILDTIKIKRVKKGKLMEMELE